VLLLSALFFMPKSRPIQKVESAAAFVKLGYQFRISPSVRRLSFERSRLLPLNTARDSEFARLIGFFAIFYFKILSNGDLGIKILLQSEL